MKSLLSDFLVLASGPLGKDIYAVPAINQPGWVYIKKKPGPRNKPGTRKSRRWVMPEKQANGVRQFVDYQSIASAEYNDPVKRAEWQAEYDAWKLKESKKGRLGNNLNGKIVRYLWDYIRIRVQEREQDKAQGNLSHEQGNDGQ